MLHFFPAKATAGIFYIEMQSVIDDSGLALNAAIFGSVFHGIGEEVEDDFFYQIFVKPICLLADIYLFCKSDVFLLGHIAKALHNSAHKLPQIAFGDDHLHFTGFYFGDIQQLIDQ